MDKRGVEYTAAIALEFVLLIMITIMLAIAVYQAPHEERINRLKVVDLSLALDSISSIEGDVYLNYDLGDGMYVEIKGDEIKIYGKSKSKEGKEQIITNSDYNFVELLEGKYNGLVIIKEGKTIRFEGK